MNNLQVLEKERGIILPAVYKEFYKSCALSVPKTLIGTDLVNDSLALNQWALELLTKNNIDSFLEKDDFVFMMHQGYIFWYFKANGEVNPFVYGYKENGTTPDKFERFSDFIKRYV